MNELTGKNVAVFGLAKSGVAAAKKLALLGANVLVTEIKPAAQIDPAVLGELADLKVEIELGGHTTKAISSAELIVVSPGVHLDVPALEKAKKRGIPVISEIELAYRFLNQPIIAVTGTNGKTTTATLIGELLKAGDKKIAVAGNIGSPLVEVNDSSLDYIVVEISSYQLETIVNFRPWISVILNIQPDHLERHGSLEEYIDQKAKIFHNQTGDDYVVFNQDDPAVVKMVKKAKARALAFSLKQPEIITLAPSEIKIPGKHNLANALAAAQAAYLCGVAKPAVAEVLRTFSGVEHRIEFVKNINGADFYNDSKATNPDSTLVALDTFQGKGIVLILGGKDKGVSLEALSQKVKQLVKAVLLIGESSDRFELALRKIGYESIHHSASLEAAVSQAKTLAGSGEIVLLSPACASFDMFANFEERGRAFKEAVNNTALTPTGRLIDYL